MKDNISAFHDQKCDEDAAFFSFVPRPDRPELFDEQTSFIDNQDSGVSFHVGGNGAGTSTAAACKIARFLLSRQEAPRYDTSFWVVGTDYEQTIESMWREKLYGMGFIPDCEINWDRVTWYDKRRELPATVPLKPWVNGNRRKNWVIEFRSFAQGRMAMQARALGGFCLTEQFPWEILVEILRGMRQHNFPGSKFCEFTPVDPALSAPLKEMMENNTLPKGWAVYRANTLCNVLDPNSPVDKEWYDEFFGMVGDELLETRRTGAWASYEGLIFKALNSRVHFVDNAPIPRNAIHKRGVDWGGGPYNAFCVLWGCKDDKGHWCYLPDMEVLTKRGWIKFEDLKTGEPVGTTNLQGKTATMEWQVPFEYQKILYDGDVIETQKQIGGVSFGVTSNHDMVLQKNFNNKGFVKRKASQLLNDGGCNYNIPITWKNCLQDDDNDTFVVGNVTTTKLNFCRFIGLWIAEGYLMKNQRSIAITQKTMLHEVEEILSKCGGKLWRKYTKKNGMTEWHLTSKELCQWVKSNGMYKYSREKTISRCLMGWGTSIRGILQGLELGDGIHHKRKNKVTERAIFTTSIQLANDIQELCALIGTPTKVTPLQYDKESFNNTRRQVPLPPVMQTVYRVNLRRSYSATPRALSLTSRKYSGYVYCVSVPNGNLIVRKEHGTPFICGNCIYDELYTTESITWEERLRLLHEKDGWSLVMDHPGPPASYKLEPHPEVPVRWRYDVSTFGQTYAPPDDPGAFRECRHYCFPVVQGKTGLSNSYHPSIECIQAMLRYTPEEFRAGTAPLLKIDRARCPNLARELQILRWQIPPSHATNPRAPKPLQIKDQDHAPDALRALIYSDWIDMQSGVAGHKVELKDRPQVRHRRGR